MLKHLVFKFLSLCVVPRLIMYMYNIRAFELLMMAFLNSDSCCTCHVLATFFNNLACALSSSLTLRSAFNVEHPYDSIGWMATQSMCADTMGDTPSAYRPADCRPKVLHFNSVYAHIYNSNYKNILVLKKII